MITSTQNSIVKKYLKLQDKKERKKEHRFIIEGIKEIKLAINNNIAIETFLVCPDVFQDNFKITTPIIEINQKVFNKLAYRQSTGGIIAIAQEATIEKLDKIQAPDTPLILVLEKLEKPGNIGAILRTADSAGVDLIILNQPLTDIYNPNIIRASLGTVFSQKIICATQEETKIWLTKNNISSLATTPAAQQKYFQANFQAGTAIIIGSEKDGLSDFWLKNCNQQILIPMSGQVDSLNASVSTAIIIYEAIRQRKYLSS